MPRMVFSEVVGTMSLFRAQCDDDTVDRLHYHYTAGFLLIVAVLISLKMFGGNPIECWLPAEFRASWQEYTELVCWSMSTYFVRGAIQTIDASDAQRTWERGQVVAYYQWTPFFLIFAAMLFYLPCVLWRTLSARSGIVLNEIAGFATSLDQYPTFANQLSRTTKMRAIAAHLTSAFGHRFEWWLPPRESSWWHFITEEWRYQQAYLATLYLAMKVLLLGIVFLQACLMNRFLQTDHYDFYGWGVLLDLLRGREWNDSGNFPRVTFCDIDVRILGVVQRHSVQCILVINIFTEKVFVLLWFWFSLLWLLTLLNALIWTLLISSRSIRREFVVRRLQMADMQFEVTKRAEQIDKFVCDFLKIDGCFVLRMLDVHIGEWICAEILNIIWNSWIDQQSMAQGATPIPPASMNSVSADRRMSGKKTTMDKKWGTKRFCLLKPRWVALPPLREQEDGLAMSASAPLWAVPCAPPAGALPATTQHFSTATSDQIPPPTAHQFAKLRRTAREPTSSECEKTSLQPMAVQSPQLRASHSLNEASTPLLARNASHDVIEQYITYDGIPEKWRTERF